LARFLPLQNKEKWMTQTAAEANIRVNGEIEPLMVATLAGLLEEKAFDTSQRGIAVAVNGAIVPRAAWPQTQLRPGDSVEIVRARQGG
jgi:sulfur carrier protein